MASWCGDCNFFFGSPEAELWRNTLSKIPTIFEVGRGISGGGLMEFGPNLEPMFRRAAVYIDKIANGADPATLPVEEPTQFELAINLKAAKAMGIEIPQSLLLRADRVVE